MEQLNENWLTVGQAAKMKGVCDDTIRNIAAQGRIETIRVGHMLLVRPTAAFHAWRRDPRGLPSAVPTGRQVPRTEEET